MKDEIECAVIGGERGDITSKEIEGGHFPGKWKLTQKTGGIPGKDGQMQSQRHFIIRVAKTAKEPLAKEPGTAGDEDFLAAELLQIPGSMMEDMGQIRVRQGEEIFL